MDCLLLETQKLATLESARELRHLLEQVVQAAVPYLSIRQQMLLCLSEAVTNLVTHAKPGVSRIGMSFGRDDTGWWLEILDDSTPWDPTENVELDLLSEFIEIENGRGTALLKNQCDQISYTAGDGVEHNRLRLSWSIPEKNQQPTILLVEDDNALRQLYALYLVDTFEVLTAANGHEALERLNTNKIDLVLSDINMPGMSGFTLREYLNQSRDTELIPFIFLTAVDDAHMQKNAAGLGIDDYLVKPIYKTQLINIVQRVLGRSQQIYRQLTDRIDKRITSALAPSLPETSHGWSLCVASRHTGIGGGDLLLHRDNKDQLLLALVDIMGHDDSAKFFAYAYGGYLRGLMHTSVDNISPSQLLEKLSENALQDELLSQVILTSCAITLSPAGKLTTASAGHPPPLLISKTGTEMLPVGGMLPGLLPATTYQTKVLQLSAGERIAFYTDGLFESAANDHARKDLETHITEKLAETLDIPIKQSLQQVMKVFDELAGTPPKDDAMLLLMEPNTS